MEDGQRMQAMAVEMKVNQKSLSQGRKKVNDMMFKEIQQKTPDMMSSN